ncbi:MAG: helix-turn-helix domain-containing protein [Fimbriimonas sp.]
MDELHEGQVPILMLTIEHNRVLSSPATAEVFDAIPGHPFSIREIAREIGKAPSSVGEHVAKLLDVGLIIQCGTRKVRSRTENLYIQKGQITRMSFLDQPWDAVEQYLVRFRGMLNQLEREHESFWKAVHVDPTYRPFGRNVQTAVFITESQAMSLRIALESLYQLANSMNEPDPEAREKGGHVRVQLHGMIFPTVVASRDRIEAVKAKSKPVFEPDESNS